MINKTLTTIILSGAMITSGYLFSTDESIIIDGQLVDPIEVVEVMEIDTIAEQFVITSVENGIIKGEMINGTGEGIYYNLDELDSKLYDVFSQLDVNDIVRIEWTTDNYNEGEWLDIEKVSYNKQGEQS